MKPKLIPPIYFLAFLLLQVLSHIYYPVKVLEKPYTYIGIAFAAAGLIIISWANYVFRKHKTTVKPHETPSALVVEGPYLFSRNPMYLSLTLALAGVALYLGTLIAFVFPLLFLISMESMFIPMEESNLDKKFGKNYHNYKKKVRRWV